MAKAGTIIAQGVSMLLYPLWIPTYGMLLFMGALRGQVPFVPPAIVWTAVGGTLLLTGVLPVSLIVYLWKKGRISTLYITDPAQRAVPYRYSTVCFGFWCYFVTGTLHLPAVWLYISAGATAALAAVAVINRKWKISAHLTAMGGLLGGIGCCGLYYGTPVTPLVIGVLGLSLLLMYARLYLNAHTPLQVCCGYLLGLGCTFLPYLIASYV